MGQQLIVAHISVKISTLRLCKTLVFQQGWCIADMESKFQRFERRPFVREKCFFHVSL